MSLPRRQRPQRRRRSRPTSTRSRTAPLTRPALTTISSVDVTDPMTVVVSMKSPWVPFPNHAHDPGGVVRRRAQDPAQRPSREPPGGHRPLRVPASGSPTTTTPPRTPTTGARGSLPGPDHLQADHRPAVPREQPQVRQRSTSCTPRTPRTWWTCGGLQLRHHRRYEAEFEPDMDFVLLNTAVAPMDDLRVRQALAYSIDKQKVINTVYNGVPPQSFGPFVQGSPYYGPTGYPDYNLSKAQSLVKQYQADHGGQPISFQWGPSITQVARVQPARPGHVETGRDPEPDHPDRAGPVSSSTPSRASSRPTPGASSARPIRTSTTSGGAPQRRPRRRAGG